MHSATNIVGIKQKEGGLRYLKSSWWATQYVLTSYQR